MLEPPQLSARERTVRLAEAEAALAEIAVGPGGAVQLDLTTENALSKAFSDLPSDSAAARRAWFLIRKAFPGRVGEQLVTLLERYSEYRNALPPPTNAADDPAAELARLETVQALQVRYFGADATALFGQQNALLRYTLELRLLELDTALDSRAREARMLALHEQLQDSVQASN